jgi:hypothetical protein
MVSTLVSYSQGVGKDECTFNDVNFPAARPWTYYAPSPKGRPGTAACRHVREVEHEYSVSISVLRTDADAVTPTRGRGNDGRIVRTHVEHISMR